VRADNKTASKSGAVLALLALVAFTLRLLPVFAFPGINYPDEIFQTIEQAHRLVFGYGMVPWEFHDGTRSWMLPGALAGLIEVSRLFGEGPDFYIRFVGVALAMLSTAAALCGALWGRRFFGSAGMVVAGLVPAVSMEAIYFGPRTLSEVIAAHILVIGLYLTTPGDPVRGWSRLALGGFLLGLAALTRIQLAPAIGVIMIWLSVTANRHRLLPLFGGASMAALLSGAIDAVTWGSPFHSVWRNLVANVIEGAAAGNGVMPWYHYGTFLMEYWGAGSIVALLLLALIGARRLPHPFVGALAILVSHSLIGHKEYRFIYPAILLLLLSSGLGLAQLTLWAIDALGSARSGSRWVGPACIAMATAFPVLMTLRDASRPEYQGLWTRGGAILRGADLVARLDSICGIGTFGLHWTQSAGYAHFHHRVPYYWPENDEAVFRKYEPAFNALLYARRPAGAEDFTDMSCIDGICVATRKGDCVALPLPAPDLPGPTIPGIMK